eukprot:Sspe_Gene.21810::Locus_8202_Transcript_1_1_Confidence_1.000_Length_4572::g.21810::m.21810
MLLIYVLVVALAAAGSAVENPEFGSMWTDVFRTRATVVNGVVLAAHGTALAVATDDGLFFYKQVVYQADVIRMSFGRQRILHGNVLSVAAAGQGNLIAAGTSDGFVHIFRVNYQDVEEIHVLSPAQSGVGLGWEGPLLSDDRRVKHLAMSAGGRVLIVGMDWYLRFYVITSKPAKEDNGVFPSVVEVTPATSAIPVGIDFSAMHIKYSHHIRGVEITPDGNFAAVIASDGSLRLLSLDFSRSGSPTNPVFPEGAISIRDLACRLDEYREGFDYIAMESDNPYTECYQRCLSLPACAGLVVKGQSQCILWLNENCYAPGTAGLDFQGVTFYHIQPPTVLGGVNTECTRINCIENFALDAQLGSVAVQFTSGVQLDAESWDLPLPGQLLVTLQQDGHRTSTAKALRVRKPMYTTLAVTPSVEFAAKGPYTTISTAPRNGIVALAYRDANGSHTALYNISMASFVNNAEEYQAIPIGLYDVHVKDPPQTDPPTPVPTVPPPAPPPMELAPQDEPQPVGEASCCSVSDCWDTFITHKPWGNCPPGQECRVPRPLPNQENRLECLPVREAGKEGDPCKTPYFPECGKGLECREDPNSLTGKCEVVTDSTRVALSAGAEAVATASILDGVMVVSFLQDKSRLPTAVPTSTSSCAMADPSPTSHTVMCNDGHICSSAGKEPRSIGDCCVAHAGIRRCPPETPLRCASTACNGGRTHCCARECDSAGGIAECPVEHNKAYRLFKRVVGRCPVGTERVTTLDDCRAAAADFKLHEPIKANSTATQPPCVITGRSIFYTSDGQAESADGIVCKMRDIVLERWGTCSSLGYQDIPSPERCQAAISAVAGQGRWSGLGVEWGGDVEAATVIDKDLPSGCFVDYESAGTVPKVYFNSFYNLVSNTSSFFPICSFEPADPFTRAPLPLSPGGSGLIYPGPALYSVVFVLLGVCLAAAAIYWAMCGQSQSRRPEREPEVDVEEIQQHWREYDELLSKLTITIDPSDSIAQCSVCLEDLIDNTCIQLPACSHQLHLDCMRKYVQHQVEKKRKKYPRCPNCRTRLLLESDEPASPGTDDSSEPDEGLRPSVEPPPSRWAQFREFLRRQRPAPRAPRGQQPQQTTAEEEAQQESHEMYGIDNSDVAFVPLD